MPGEVSYLTQPEPQPQRQQQPAQGTEEASSDVPAGLHVWRAAVSCMQALGLKTVQTALCALS